MAPASAESPTASGPDTVTVMVMLDRSGVGLALSPRPEGLTEGVGVAVGGTRRVGVMLALSLAEGVAVGVSVIAQRIEAGRLITCRVSTISAARCATSFQSYQL